jgi:hypothetical protein
MRRLFVFLAAVGLLGGVIGCDCTHGRCDCDDAGYGCVGCGGCGGWGAHGDGLAPAAGPYGPYGALVPSPGPAHDSAPSSAGSLASVPK